MRRRSRGHRLSSCIAVVAGAAACARFNYDLLGDPAASGGSAGAGATSSGGAPATGGASAGTTSSSGGSSAGSAGDASAGSASGGSSAGGASDGGAVGAGGSASSQCPSGPEILFCDDFEDGGFPQWDAPEVVDGTVTQDTANPYAGAGALDAATTAYEGHAYLTLGGLPAQTNGDLYLRFYLYVASGYVLDELDIAAVTEDQASPQGVAVSIFAESFSVVTTDDVGQDALVSGLVPRDVWTCLELHVAIAEPSGAAQLFVDGELEVDLQSVDTRPTNGYSALALGITRVHLVQEPVRVLLDGLVLSTAPVGCD